MMKDTNRWVGATLLMSVCFVVSASIRHAHADPDRVSSEVTIAEVQVRLSDHGPVVLLRAEGKVIPIFVDDTVAGSIQGALTGVKLPRPLSHDLMHTILES